MNNVMFMFGFVLDRNMTFVIAKTEEAKFAESINKPEPMRKI